jgi:hypothetical protein
MLIPNRFNGRLCFLFCGGVIFSVGATLYAVSKKRRDESSTAVAELSPASADKFRPGELWADINGVPINAHGGGVLFHDGTYFWFGEHKIEGNPGNYAQVGVRVYSSSDLHRWEDKGIALPVSSDPASELARGCILERPKVIFNSRTKKFVMWFHLELKGQEYRSARSAVAVADQPAGPYRFVGSLRPNAGIWPENVPVESRKPLSADEIARLAGLEFAGGPSPEYPQELLFRRDFAGGQMARDQTVFVDDDGIAYHIYASEENGALHMSQLSDDYLRPAGRYVRIFPGEFREAPAVMKWRGRYFLITSACTGWKPNPARIAVADSMFGPWKDLGSPCIGNARQMANTFESQSAFILPVAGLPDAFIFIADRWRPRNPIDGRHVWLPIELHDDVPKFRWRAEWDLGIFERAGS